MNDDVYRRIVQQRMQALLEAYDNVNLQYETNQIRLAQDLASRFRFSKSEIGEILGKMIEEDTIKRQNRLRIRIR